MKKVLYVYLEDFSAVSGVTNKLKGLFAALEAQKVEWTLFTLSSTTRDKQYLDKNIYTLPYSSINDLTFIYKELDAFIKDSPAYDLHFFRYALSSGELVSFLKKHPGLFIFEHNTIEPAEVIERAYFWIKKFKFRISPSYLKLILNVLVRPVLKELLYAGKVFKLAKQGIAVTNEIAVYQKTKYPGYKCSVLSNGINVQKINFFERSLKKGDVLNLIMLANSNVDWHGTDIIINEFLKYKKNNIKIFFVGEFDEKVRQLAQTNPNIVFTGFLSSEEYKEYLKTSHIGLGCFAVYRKKLEEASTLKVREYFASGLPVCLGYIDTDIVASTALQGFSYQLDTRKEEINWDNLYEWACNLYKTENLSRNIREEAFKQLDFSNRVKTILEL